MKSISFVALGCAMFLAACHTNGASAQDPGTEAAPALQAGQAAAVFAGGCFWCMEKPFDLLEGVVSTTSGYTGGAELHPTYRQVANHKTSHYEAIRVVYDPAVVTYAALLETFWHNVDPTDARGQFCDKGDQYRTGIFTDDPTERRLAEESKAAAQVTLGQPLVTQVLPGATFWIAEENHQDFYLKNPSHYRQYRRGCGRDRRLEELWGAAAGH
jgi:peptide-methionine (S)-S-oxide reductase